MRGCVTRRGTVSCVCKPHGQTYRRHGAFKAGWGGVCGRRAGSLSPSPSLPCARAPAPGCRCRGLGRGCSAPSITRSALSRADMAVSRAPRLADLILFISARAEPARAGSLKAPSITGGGSARGGGDARRGTAGCEAAGLTPGKSTGQVGRWCQGPGDGCGAQGPQRAPAG